jgi:uncharacterized protein
MSSEGYHEASELLPEHVRDTHRAIVSLMEELEAVDWYYQRAAATNNAPLRGILLHNANEEVEHAMMILEWIRRNNPVFDQNMREYLFKEGDIVATEHGAGEGGQAVAAGPEAAATGPGGDTASLGNSAGAGALDALVLRRPKRTLGSLRAEGPARGPGRDRGER